MFAYFFESAAFSLQILLPFFCTTTISIARIVMDEEVGDNRITGGVDVHICIKAVLRDLPMEYVGINIGDKADLAEDNS